MTTAEQKNDQAFMDGVRETATFPIVWADPKQFNTDDPALMAKALEQQLEAQIPGITASMHERIKEIQANLGNIWTRDATKDEVLQVYANAFDKQGPRVVDSIKHDGISYCVVNKPNGFVDTKSELLDIVTRGIISKENYDNFDGNDQDWNKLFGRHEGAHCPTPTPLTNDVDIQNEEGRADRVTMRGLDEKVALSWADARHLQSFQNEIVGQRMDIKHSVGILLASDDEKATDWHAAAARSYKHVVDYAVQNTFDWDAHTGTAKTPDELLKETPEAYFKALHEGLTPHIQEMQTEYTTNPSYDNTAAAVLTQHTLDYIANLEDAYRRRELGQDIPADRPRIEIIHPQLEEQFYYAYEQEIRQEMIAFSTGDDFRFKRPHEYTPLPRTPALEQAPANQQQHQHGVESGGLFNTNQEYAQGIDGTPFTTKVNTPIGGEPTLSHENGITVQGGTQMPEFFGQNANPAAQDITLINATITDTTQGPEAITTQSGLNAQIR